MRDKLGLPYRGEGVSLKKSQCSIKTRRIKFTFAKRCSILNVINGVYLGQKSRCKTSKCRGGMGMNYCLPIRVGL